MAQLGQHTDWGSGLSSLGEVQESLGNSTETTPDTLSSSPLAKVPRMLLAVRLKNSLRVGELSPDLFKEWLRNIPAAVEEVKVEAGFDSFSSIIIVSISISLSIYLPQDPAIIKLGPITSLNQIPDALRLEEHRVQHHRMTAPKSASRIERVETGIASASSIPLDTSQADKILWKNSQIKMRRCIRCQEQNLICDAEDVKTCSACAKSAFGATSLLKKGHL